MVAACTLLTALAPVTSGAADSETIESYTLSNGLEVVVIPNHRVAAVSQMVWYRIGAADDPLGKSGLAHFHEHNMFLGTKKHKAGEYSNIIARNGGQENAFTGYDATSYYINISKDKLPLAMELESDRMNDLMPTDADVKKEKQVIIEERRMRIENNPQALLAEQMNAALFRNHPYHWPVIGWMHEMEVLNEADVLAFHKRWYHPNNAVLIISGDVTLAEVKPLVQKYYGSLPKVAVPARVWNSEPPQISPRHLVLHHKNVKQPSLHRIYMAASLGWGNKDTALPLFVLSNAMGEGKTCRLYQSLVVDQKLATDVDINYNGFTLGPSEFEIDMVPEQGIAAEVLEKALDKEIAKIVAEGFSDSDIARAKTQLKAETVYARDGLTAMARIMGWIRMVGLNVDYFTRWPNMIDAVTAEQVKSAAKDTLQANQSVTGFLLPEGEP